MTRDQAGAHIARVRYDGRAVSPRLEQLTGRWRTQVGAAARRLSLMLVLLAAVAAAHVARVGTLGARLVAVAAMVLVSAGVVAWRVRERRTLRSARGQLQRVLLGSDPALGERALRALSLLERAPWDPTLGSAELARHHFERLVGRFSEAQVAARAARRARLLKGVAWTALVGVVGTLLVLPWHVLEGFDVLFARAGHAPVPMTWLELTRVSSQPPGYLRMSERSLFTGFVNEQPQGSVLSVRGVPTREGRSLVLTDGRTEVPFVSDAAGGVVARWTMKQDAELRVAARFGDVLISEPGALEVHATPDKRPTVVLEGAPRTVSLAELDRLELRYLAVDDHGLRQVDLVLRSGGREERRILSRLDGERLTDRGGHALRSSDPFMRRVFLPVLVSIEARDNDPVGGPKWGRSEPVTVVPPAVAEPEARRYQALERARDAVVDVLAARLREARPDELRTVLASAQRALQEAVDGSPGAKPIPAGLRTFLLGQLRVLGAASGSAAVAKSEDVLLALDAVLRQMAVRDARATAKRLGDVAEEIADGAKQARETEQREQGLSRVDAAIGAVERGSRFLAELGTLGADLGSVAEGQLGRIRRARSLDNMTHTELAARHLTERLRRPSPSFAGGGRGGVESGGAPQSPEPSADSQAEGRFNQLASELEQLADEHASELERVERALAEAEEAGGDADLTEEAERRAEAVRNAVRPLPPTSIDPGSARAKAATAREHGSAMAQALERLSLEDAVQSGKQALEALDQAAKRANESSSFRDWLSESDLSAARRALEQELGWAEQMLQQARARAEERARAALGDASRREQGLADRAGDLAGRGQEGQTSLPEDIVDSLERAEKLMRDAARELAAGRGEPGSDLQREAQRLLEEASVGKTHDEEDSNQEQSAQDGSGKSIRTGGEVPPEDAARKAEEFRRRVLEGLGRDRSGRLAPAVKRYAEGLLR